MDTSVSQFRLHRTGTKAMQLISNPTTVPSLIALIAMAGIDCPALRVDTPDTADTLPSLIQLAQMDQDALLAL